MGKRSQEEPGKKQNDISDFLDAHPSTNEVIYLLGNIHFFVFQIRTNGTQNIITVDANLHWFKSALALRTSF